MDDGGSSTGGRPETVTDQELLIAFDTTEDPILTAAELAEQFDVTPEAIRQRLEDLHEEGKVGKKKTGARSVAWWAEVAPQLSSDAARDVEAARRADSVPLEESDRNAKDE